MADQQPDPFYRISIVSVRPQIDCGRFPIKRIVGDRLRVTADIIKEGHDTLGAEVRYRRQGSEEWESVPMSYSYDDDEWSAEIPIEFIGMLEYTVAAWTEVFISWTHELSRKVAAGRDVSSELLEGLELIRQAEARAVGEPKVLLAGYINRLQEASTQREKVDLALTPELAQLVSAHEAREDLTLYNKWLRVIVDREKARFGAWYEMFPRSQTDDPHKHGTFRTAMKRLEAIKDMGFDVLYLPPIHPIGFTNRKGRNNALVAQPGDPGSPWAIGNQYGGHDAVNPELGTIEDFDAFVREAQNLGIEVALDLAIQCSPDHPYVREHPEWFRKRPDGTIKYAENPPKKYEDIVALDMWCEDFLSLWNELKRVVLFWIEHGIRIFRVDNPHTKPVAFWEWLISEIKREHPDVIFLSEAFTRPKKLQLLAKIGFSQSYTYFTWRNSRWEIEQFMHELLHTEQVEFLRPNFFANTPDILTEYLQKGGRPAFKIRLALAATLSPTYGIYSGFELIENVPLHPGSEEYLNSEKYEIRVRDWNAPGNIIPYIKTINQARKQNRALQLYTNLTFHYPDNPNIIAYSKISEDGSNRILVIANLDPFNWHECTVHLNGEALHIAPWDTYTVHDLITDAYYQWHGTANYVRLDPNYEPVHLFRIE